MGQTNRVFPDQPIIHRPVLGGLAAGSILLASGVASTVVTVAGATRWRIRIKASHAGTLSAKYCRPDQPNDTPVPYALFGPADVVLVANTENHMDVDPHFGEALVQLTLTNAGGGSSTIAFCDLMAVHLG